MLPINEHLDYALEIRFPLILHVKTNRRTKREIQQRNYGHCVSTPCKLFREVNQKSPIKYVVHSIY